MKAHEGHGSFVCFCGSFCFAVYILDALCLILNRIVSQFESAVTSHSLSLMPIHHVARWLLWTSVVKLDVVGRQERKGTNDYE